ncbi:eCIS core domain-containing protein [Algoriphagus namhaensis]
MRANLERSTKTDFSPKSQQTHESNRQVSSAIQFVDNRRETLVQKGIKQMADQRLQNNSPTFFSDGVPVLTESVNRLKDTLNSQNQYPVFQKKENNTGLPDRLKSGIENLSGVSMDDVKVHRNSDKPAQLQAHAYAQDTDIHLAPGQEKHLPHEAWHVVQQKQGRVKPTLQMKGAVNINDDAGLENEADVMGAKAASIGLHGPPVADEAAFRPVNVSVQRKVIQLISSQIVMNDDPQRIRHIVIRGRPPRAHGSRMGDHSTAFIVHVEGLNIKLQNLTIPEAINALDEMFDHIRELPGIAIFETPDVQKELNEFNRHIAGSILAYHTGGGEDMAIHHLQLAVNAYLRARELVPFSTINVAAISSGLAGKGHGESRHAAILSQFERGLDKSITNENLIEAVYGLFDDQAAGMVAVENDPSLVNALVGRNVEDQPSGAKKRLEPIWNQHLKSIEAMFPKCFALIKDQLLASKLEPRLIQLDQTNMEWGLDQARNRLDQLNRSLENSVLEFVKLKKLPQRSGKFVISKLSTLAKLYRDFSKVNSLIPGLDRINNRLGGKYSGELKRLRSEASQLRARINKELPQYDKETQHETAIKTSSHLNSKFAKTGTGKKDLQDLYDVSVGPPSSPGSPLSYPLSPAYTGFGMEEESENPEPKLPVSTLSEEGLSPLSSDDGMDISGESEAGEEEFEINAPKGTIVHDTHSMSIQLMLKATSGLVRIVGMLSSGRPPSPFKGSMGAHSTAWIVHLDRVRRRLMGKTLQEAVKEMHLLIGETLSLGDHLSKGTLGDNAQYLIDEARASIENAGKITGEEASIDRIQQMITHTLSYLNLLPTISQNSIKTTGNAEGVWRAVLLNFEYENIGTFEEVNEAIGKLYDSQGAKAKRRHLDFIAQAYPRAAAFAETGKKPEIGGGLDALRPISNDLDDSSASESGSTKLDSSDVDTMRKFYSSENYLDRKVLAGLNNCLFDAIADAANIARPSIETVIRVRVILNVPLGTMLSATQQNLDIILEVMGLSDRGAMVFYRGGDWTDTTTHIGENVLYIQHDGINHFTAARQFMPDREADLEVEKLEGKLGGKDSFETENKGSRKIMMVINPPSSFLKIGATLFSDGITWKVVDIKKGEEENEFQIELEPLAEGMVVMI